MSDFWKPKTQGIEDQIDWWEKAKKALSPVEGMPWWQYPLEGLEQFSDVAGSVLTSPFRPVGKATGFSRLNPQSYLPGGSEYEAYKKWEEKGDVPTIPVGIPSWKQMKEWGVPYAGFFAEEGEKPEGYEMAQMGMPEVAELAPWMFLGGGLAKKPLEKIGETTFKQVTKGKTLEEAAKISYQKAAKKGILQEATAGIKTNPTTELVVRHLELPARTETHDMKQLLDMHKLARRKNLLNKKTGKPTKSYRNLAEIYTGKTSARDMTRAEADNFIKALQSLEVVGKHPPKIPKMTSPMVKEFWDSIPYLKDVGFVDYLRQKPQVLRKLGMDDMADDLMKREVEFLEEKQLFINEITGMKAALGKDITRQERLFDALEHPLKSHLLDPEEQDVYLYARKFFDNWANQLKLTPEQRKKNYITHIFDAQLKADSKEGKTLPLEILKALEFNYPKQTYMPFLKQRLGAQVGLKRDPFAAMEVYEAYALRNKYYKPFLQKLSSYITMFEARGKMTSANYLKDMARRIAGRPAKEDLLINENLGDFAKTLSKLPGLKGSAGLRLEQLGNRGNLGALVAHNFASLYYTAWLGFRPAAAVRNFSQQLLAASVTGPSNLGRGIGLRFTQEGKTALKESLVYRGRLLSEPVAGLEEAQLQRLPAGLQKKALAMFKFADKQNVSDSFLAGYAQGKQLGLPREWSIRLGDEVAANTQFLYTKMARSLLEETLIVRFLTPFTSWPRNFFELFTKFVQGRQSLVLQQYVKETGKNIVIPERDLKPLLTYMAILGGAYAAEGATAIKATEYTGWTSIKGLGRIIGGDIPSWQLIKGVSNIVAGAASGDERAIKEGWNDIRPDKFIQIIKQLEDIAEGKADILSLFFYLDREEMKKKGTSSGGASPAGGMYPGGGSSYGGGMYPQ